MNENKSKTPTEPTLSAWGHRIMQTLGSQNEKRRVMLYGKAGVGKTRLALMFPHPFIFDTDKGLKTAIKMKVDVPYVAISRSHDPVWKLITTILKDFREKKVPFKVETIIIDSMTALSEHLMYDAMKRPPHVMTKKGEMLQSMNRDDVKPQWDHYDLIKSRLLTICDDIADLNLNLVVTAGVKLEKDEITGAYIGEPNILGGFRHLALHAFDEVYFMAVEGLQEKKVYSLYTSKYKYFDAKTKEEGLADHIKDPSYDELYKKEKSK